MLPTKLQNSFVPKSGNNHYRFDSIKTTDATKQFQGSKLNLNYLLLHLHGVNNLFPWSALAHTLCMKKTQNPEPSNNYVGPECMHWYWNLM